MKTVALFGAGKIGEAITALFAKILRRVGVLVEDLRVLPGRSGLSAATMSGMAAGAVLVPYAPGLALGLVVAALVPLSISAEASRAAAVRCVIAVE